MGKSNYELAEMFSAQDFVDEIPTVRDLINLMSEECQEASQ